MKRWRQLPFLGIFGTSAINLPCSDLQAQTLREQTQERQHLETAMKNAMARRRENVKPSSRRAPKHHGCFTARNDHTYVNPAWLERLEHAA